MKVMGMCLLENENGAIGVGFRRKKGGHWVWDQNNSVFYGVNFPKYRRSAV